jgi:N6-L-threonylcarbamoyladenine synthase
LFVVKTILALETSCDETAVAILQGDTGDFGSELLASEVASQTAAHEKYGGIVPEIASRSHLIYAPRLLDRAARTAKVALSEMGAFAATSGPGLASSLMIGASIAKGLAIGFGKPYLAINHLEGHLLSPFFGTGIGILALPGISTGCRRHISLIVSGGHTMLTFVRGLSDYQLIGRTVDDAAGEAFDKVAKMLGLGYPGGPEIERHARSGDRGRFDFPRSMPDSENFSFSGLKTAVRYLLPKIGVIPNRADSDRPHTRSLDYAQPKCHQSSCERSTASVRDERVISDLCASFQQAVIDVLVMKTVAAAREYRVDLVTVSGGVSCNQELRRQLGEACARDGFEFKNAEPWLCTDNAAMIAFAGLLRLNAGFQSEVTEEIDPNLTLGL